MAENNIALPQADNPVHKNPNLVASDPVPLFDEDNGQFICRTDQGTRPLPLSQFLSVIATIFPSDQNLQPYIRLGYKNAAVEGYAEDLYLPRPKVTPCKGYNLCIEIEKYIDFGRIAAVDFLKQKAKEQLALKHDIEETEVDLMRDEDVQLRVYKTMIILEIN